MHGACSRIPVCDAHGRRGLGLGCLRVDAGHCRSRWKAFGHQQQLGLSEGGHTGWKCMEQSIHRWTCSEEGVVFVSSNGNNGDVDFFHLDHRPISMHHLTPPATMTRISVRSRIKFYPAFLPFCACRDKTSPCGSFSPCEPGASFQNGAMCLLLQNCTIGLSTHCRRKSGLQHSRRSLVVGLHLVINKTVFRSS